MTVPFLKINKKFSLYDTEFDKENIDRFFGDCTDFSKVNINEFDFIEPFVEGFAIAYQNNKPYFLRPNGEILKTKHEYYELREFKNGIAAVCRDYKHGYSQFRFINKNGDELIDRAFEEYNYIENGFIEVHEFSSYYYDSEDRSFHVSEISSGLIDNTGHLLIKPIKGASFTLHKNFIEVYCSSERNSSTLYYDYGGNRINNKKFKLFSYIGKNYKNRGISILEETNEYVITDDDLNIIKNLKTTNIEDFCESYFIFERYYDTRFFNGLCAMRKEGKWGIINSDGEFVLNPKYDFIGAFTDFKSWNYNSSGCAVVGKLINSKMKYNIIDSNFNELNNFIFDEIDLFDENITRVEINGKWGAINSKGEIIIPIEYNHIRTYRTSGLIEVGLGDYDSNNFIGHYGFFDNKENKITKIIYQFLSVLENGFAICKKNNKYGLLNENGHEVIPCIYDNLDFKQNDLYLAMLNEVKFYMDSNGRKYIQL